MIMGGEESENERGRQNGIGRESDKKEGERMIMGGEESENERGREREKKEGERE
jgi:hypothetical protein